MITSRPLIATTGIAPHEGERQIMRNTILMRGQDLKRGIRIWIMVAEVGRGTRPTRTVAGPNGVVQEADRSKVSSFIT